MGFWDVAKYAIPGYGAYQAGKAIYNSEQNANSLNEQQRQALRDQANAASGFANQGQANYAATGAEGLAARNYLRDIASGKTSLAGEQLRQGAQQNIGGQIALAASAAPQNAAMAARQAAMQSARIGSGLAGQQAMAGIQERESAANSLNNAIGQARGQDVQAALGARGTAVDALTKQEKEKSLLDTTVLPLAQSVLPFLTKSDRRAKEDIEDADGETRKIVDGLKAYRYNYRDAKHGKGSQYGIMAQDLERVGLGHAVINARDGKYVDGAKLSTSNTAMISSLGKRIAKLEKDRE